MLKISHTGLAILITVPALIAGCFQTDAAPPFGLAPDRLPAETTTSDMAIVDEGNRMSLGTARREMSRVNLDGNDAIRFVLVQKLRQGTMFDTLWVDAETLLPIKYRNESGEVQRIRVDYGNNGHVVSKVTRGDTITGVDTVITGPHLDQAEFSMLIPALPLAEGYAAELPVFHYENGATTTTVRVVSSDRVEYNGEMRDVWMVETGSAQATSRHAVDKETGVVLRVDAGMGADRRFEQVARATKVDRHD
jgi:hypothetical protein